MVKTECDRQEGGRGSHRKTGPDKDRNTVTECMLRSFLLPGQLNNNYDAPVLVSPPGARLKEYCNSLLVNLIDRSF